MALKSTDREEKELKLKKDMQISGYPKNGNGSIG